MKKRLRKCYGNDNANCAKYGRLYNWETAKTVCPDGWRLPSDAEWTTLTNYVGSNAGTKLKSTTGWNNNGNGTDTYGFLALPGGSGSNSENNAGRSGYWWSATEYDSDFAYGRAMDNGSDVYRNYYGKSLLFSVRCLKDDFSAPSSSSSIPSSSSSFSGVYGSPVTYGGETYVTVVIGTQTWFARNLNYNPGTGTSACYDNQASNCSQYGRLYDWETAKMVCPNGWHLPSDAEWTTLTNYVGDKAGTKLKATGTDDYLNIVIGTDDYGFSALQGGEGNLDSELFEGFHNIDIYSRWWSSTEVDSRNAWFREISYYGVDVRSTYTIKSFLFSVRCLKN